MSEDKEMSGMDWNVLQFEFSKKSERVEQARRNVEALTRLMPYVADGTFFAGETIRGALLKNVKVMDEVENLK